MLVARWRPLLRRPSTPFVTGRQATIFHACYHKVGTVWFKGTLRAVASNWDLPFAVAQHHPRGVPPDARIVLDTQSRLDLTTRRDFRASHMIRDPRDIITRAHDLLATEP